GSSMRRLLTPLWRGCRFCGKPRPLRRRRAPMIGPRNSAPTAPSSRARFSTSSVSPANFDSLGFGIWDSSLPVVARLRRQPRIFDRQSHRKVIKALPLVAGETEQVVHRVVVVAADPCCTAAGRFGLEIQHLANEATFP